MGDLTAMPAMARIVETHPGSARRVWAEVPDDLSGYLPDGADVTWLDPPADGGSRLAEVVERLDWPDGRRLLLDGRGVRRRCGRSAST